MLLEVPCNQLALYCTLVCPFNKAKKSSKGLSFQNLIIENKPEENTNSLLSKRSRNVKPDSFSRNYSQTVSCWHNCIQTQSDKFCLIIIVLIIFIMLSRYNIIHITFFKMLSTMKKEISKIRSIFFSLQVFHISGKIMLSELILRFYITSHQGDICVYNGLLSAAYVYAMLQVVNALGAALNLNGATG